MTRYRIDDEKAPVREIQRFLLELAYANPEIPKVTMDGIYGDLTRDAVKAFQKNEELPETGIVDYPTWQRLYARRQEARNIRTAETAFPHTSEFDLRLGDTGSAVIALQAILGEFARIYPAVIRPAVTGQFGLATADAVRALQRNYGRYADGIVTAELWNRMLRDYASKKEWERTENGD